MIFNKQIWSAWWDKLQQDIADCLQDRVLNFDSLMGTWGIVMVHFFPTTSILVAGILSAYNIARKGQ